MSEQAQIQSVINQIWDTYDVDGSGALDYEETKQFLKKTFANLNMAQDFSEEAYRQTFQQFDVDDSGLVEKAEMYTFVKQVMRGGGRNALVTRKGKGKENIQQNMQTAETKNNKIVETLQQEGFIDQLRARLRAQVVQKLEAEKKKELGSAAKYMKPLSLSTTRKVVGNEDGLLCAELIREFLSFYKMEHTLSVFVPEMSLHADFPKRREEMARDCGIARSDCDEGKPLLLSMVEKVRVGDYGPGSLNRSPGTDEFSNSPGQMKPHFNANQRDQNDQNYDQTPPTTGIQGSGENENSRKNTKNMKSKQSKNENVKARKGAPFDESNSSDKKNKKQEMTSLGDLPGFGNPTRQVAQKDDFGFAGFDDEFGENDDDDDHYRNQNQNNMSKYSNAEKYLDEFDNEERDGFKLEVKGPNKNKSGSGNSKKKKSFSNKFGNDKNGRDEDDDEIEEDIQTERDQDKETKIELSLGHQAGITVSQSLGIDPSVDDLALDEYDHIEVVET